MPSPLLEKITKIKPGQLLNRSGILLNQIMAFFTGLFLSAIFFLFMLKLLNATGILMALAISFLLYFSLKKYYQKFLPLSSFNKGIFTFDIIVSVLFLIIYFALPAILQNVIS